MGSSLAVPAECCCLLACRKLGGCCAGPGALPQPRRCARCPARLPGPRRLAAPACAAPAQATPATHAAPAVYAALVAVVNTKFPELGELLLHRVVTQVGRLPLPCKRLPPALPCPGQPALPCPALASPLALTPISRAHLPPVLTHCGVHSMAGSQPGRGLPQLPASARVADAARVPPPLPRRPRSSSGRTSATISRCAPQPSGSLPTWPTSRWVLHAAWLLLPLTLLLLAAVGRRCVRAMQVARRPCCAGSAQLHRRRPTGALLPQSFQPAGGTPANRLCSLRTAAIVALPGAGACAPHMT